MSDHGQYDTCDRCGALISVGDFPFCPHGRYAGNNAVDTLPGGARFIENLGPEPIWIETKTQLARECKARGLVPFVRHVESAAKTKHTSRWV